MTIEVLDVSQSEEPSKFGPKKNKALTVTFKGEDGKIDAKKLFDWATPPTVWEAINHAPKGTLLNIEKEKNEKGYWEWKEVHRQDSVKTEGSAKMAPAPTRPTYETPEERAQKQVMIVRQSSLSTAVAYWAQNPAKAHVTNPQDVIAVAKEFEKYVMGTSIYDMESDVPN
jgi:hypothetical protein